MSLIIFLVVLFIKTSYVIQKLNWNTIIKPLNIYINLEIYMHAKELEYDSTHSG